MAAAAGVAAAWILLCLAASLWLEEAATARLELLAAAAASRWLAGCRLPLAGGGRPGLGC